MPHKTKVFFNNFRNRAHSVIYVKKKTSQSYA